MKRVQWGPSCSMRTDGRRHDEAEGRFSQVCELANNRTTKKKTAHKMMCDLPAIGRPHLPLVTVCSVIVRGGHTA